MANKAKKLRLIISLCLFILAIAGFGLLVAGGINSFNESQLAEEANQTSFILSGILKFVAAGLGVIFSVLGLLAIKRKDDVGDIFSKASTLFVVFGLFLFAVNLLEGAYYIKVEAKHIDQYMIRVVSGFIAAGFGIIAAGLLNFSSSYEIDEQRKNKLLMCVPALVLIVAAIILKLVTASMIVLELVSFIIILVSALLACCYLCLPLETENK